MLELMLCSMFTILPDYLFRRYVQGRRFGKEITFYSVWFELRWGITGCVILTVALITTVFYNHPSTTSVTMFFRTVPIVPETNGRVAEVYIAGISGRVAQGAPIFRLDSSTQQAAVDTAHRKIAEVDAETVVAQNDILKADGQLQEARSLHQQTVDELETKRELQRRNPGGVAQRDIERLEVQLEGRLGSITAATAAKQTAEMKISSLLPAQKASAEAALAQAEVELRKTVVRAGVAGEVTQFALRVGDIVNPFMRPAGVLIPDEAGRKFLQAGFGQIEAQIMKVGMIAEVTCVSKPFTVIPMVVTEVQDYIAAGQFRGGEQLIDAQQVRQPGTLLTFLAPLYPGGIDDVTPGSSCIANAYSNNHDAIADPKTGTMKGLALHAVDALGLVHALILRLQALILPFKVLVFSGH
jgi:multidrug resistance efflux pump